MRAYIILIILFVALIAGGVAYRLWLTPAAQVPVETTSARKVNVTIPLHSWTFSPDTIEATMGERLSVTVKNDDDVEHGFAIDAYDIRQSVPAGATVVIPVFTLTKGGDFQFYCSMVCGEGMAENGPHKGEKRGHFNMDGMLHIKAL